MPNPNRPSRIPTQAPSELFIKSKVQFFADVHVWPEHGVLDPERWLGNFLDEERPFALNLLNVFLYYNDLLVDALFHRAVHELSSGITASSVSSSEAATQWQSFLRNLRVTYVEGEKPNPTDSGLLFARKARQILGIDEEQIVAPADALLERLRDGDRRILVVDDFVGSGNQMKETWHRVYADGSEDACTFASAAGRGAKVVYVPLVSTSYGLDNLTVCCPGLDVRPVHVLDNSYSLIHPKSVLWPDGLRADAQDFLLTASRRAGVVDELGDMWKGYCGLALPIAFSHCVPDATLPLYYWEENGWAPLIRQR